MFAKNSSLKRPVFYYQRQTTFCNILVDKNAAGVCFKIITVIIHYQLPGVYCRSQETRYFEKRDNTKTSFFRR